MRASDFIARAHESLLAPDKTFLMDSVGEAWDRVYWPSLRQLEFYHGAQWELFTGGRRDGRKAAQLALTQLKLEVLMAKTKTLNRRSGKTAGALVGATVTGRTYGPANVQEAIPSEVPQSVDLVGFKKLTVRQQQTNAASRSLVNVARAVQENRESGKVPLGGPSVGLPPAEDVIRKSVAQIPERLLRGVLVNVVAEMLDYRGTVRHMSERNDRLQAEVRTEEARRAELHQKFETLADAVKLVTKIADAL